MTTPESAQVQVRPDCVKRAGPGPCCFDHWRGTCCQCGRSPRSCVITDDGETDIPFCSTHQVYCDELGCPGGT